MKALGLSKVLVCASVGLVGDGRGPALFVGAAGYVGCGIGGGAT